MDKNIRAWPQRPARPNLSLFFDVAREYYNQTNQTFHEALVCRDLIPVEYVTDRTYGSMMYSMRTDLMRQSIFLSSLNEVRQAELLMRESLLFAQRCDPLDILWRIGTPYGEVYSETSHWFGDDIALKLFDLGVFLWRNNNVEPLKHIAVMIHE